MKCPNCERTFSNVNLQGPTIGNTVSGPLLSGYTAVCPLCQAVLGVTVNPDVIVKQVLDGLGVAPKRR
jgi:hypothetical protein